MKIAVRVGVILFGFIVLTSSIVAWRVAQQEVSIVSQTDTSVTLTCRDAAHQPSPEWVGEKLVVRCVAVVGAGCSR